MKTFFSVCAFLLISCVAYSQSVVGTWKATVPTDDQGNTMTLTFEMGADKSFSFTQGSDPTQKGTYETKGSEIHIKVASEECNGTVVCGYAMSGASTMVLTVKDNPCGDGNNPPPLTLKKQ